MNITIWYAPVYVPDMRTVPVATLAPLEGEVIATLLAAKTFENGLTTIVASTRQNISTKLVILLVLDFNLNTNSSPFAK